MHCVLGPSSFFFFLSTPPTESPKHQARGCLAAQLRHSPTPPLPHGSHLVILSLKPASTFVTSITRLSRDCPIWTSDLATAVQPRGDMPCQPPARPSTVVPPHPLTPSNSTHQTVPLDPRLFPIMRSIGQPLNVEPLIGLTNHPVSWLPPQ